MKSINERFKDLILECQPDLNEDGIKYILECIDAAFESVCECEDFFEEEDNL